MLIRGTGSRRKLRADSCQLFLASQILDDAFERGDDFLALDAGLGELQRQVEGLRRRLVAEDVRLRTAWLWFRGFLADRLAGGDAVASEFLDQGDHFLGVALPNYL